MKSKKIAFLALCLFIIPYRVLGQDTVFQKLNLINQEIQELERDFQSLKESDLVQSSRTNDLIDSTGNITTWLELSLESFHF